MALYDIDGSPRQYVRHSGPCSTCLSDLQRRHEHGLAAQRQCSRCRLPTTAFFAARYITDGALGSEASMSPIRSLESTAGVNPGEDRAVAPRARNSTSIHRHLPTPRPGHSLRRGVEKFKRVDAFF
jgi:hypothetical protein